MYMGIDIGTSAVKAVVIDDSGAVADQASAPLSVSRPQPLWSEQNPADWWSAANIAVSDLRLTLRKAVRAAMQGVGAWRRGHAADHRKSRHAGIHGAETVVGAAT